MAADLPPQLALNQHERPARLLLVDDQPLIIQVLHQIFIDDDYELLFATSAQQALELCRSSLPDLVLTDVRMPQMGGLELCKILKQQDDTRDIPVIFVTAGDNPSEEDACWEAGGVDFITKPVNPNTVRHRVRAHLTLKRQTDILRRMAWVDGLTGVANRRYFDERLPAEWRRSLRAPAPPAMAVLMIDVDHFKRYNDSFGHQAGDDCLCQVALAIRSCLRRSHDLVARYGGEEFCCLLPETDLAAAQALGERILEAVAALGISHVPEAGGRVSVSIGVAARLPSAESSPEALIKAADQALYAAKAAGRGCVRAES